MLNWYTPYYNNNIILRALYLINSPTSMISSLRESLSARAKRDYLGLLIIDGGQFNQV